MAHALPEPEPQPSPELFTKTFWLVTIARVVRGAAVGGTAVLGAQTFDTLNAIPWNGYVTGSLVGAIMSLSASLATMFIPDSSSVVARFTNGPTR